MSDPLTYPPLSDELKARGMWSLLGLFGPGAVVASVSIGSGETVFASRGGAIFGYTLLWCFVGGGIMKFVQVYTASRYITLTGEHPIERWKYLPGPKGWAVWLLAGMSVLCFPLWLSGLPKMLGGLMVWIFHFEDSPVWNDPRVWGTIFIIIAVTLTLLQNYTALERTQTLFVALLLSSIILSVVATNPDWIAALQGTFIPSLPTYEPWVVDKYHAFAERSEWVEVGVYLGAIGGGTQDYFGYIGLLREKGWGLMIKPVSAGPAGVNILTDEANLDLGKKWLRAPFVDGVISFGCVVIFTMAFMILGANILHPQEIIPSGSQLLSVQAEFLTVFHPKLLYFYQIGVFMAFFGTILAAYELYVRAFHECLKPVLPKIRSMPINKLRPWVVGYCGIGGLTIMWLVDNPILIVTPAALFGGVLACGLWCLLMIWTDRKFLPKPLQMGKLLLILNFLSGIFLTLWGIRGIYEFVISLTNSAIMG